VSDVQVLKKNVPHVQVLMLSNNNLSSSDVFRNMPNLRELYLRNNNFSLLGLLLDHLMMLPTLQVLCLAGNPCAKPGYRYYQRVFLSLPHLQVLDAVRRTDFMADPSKYVTATPLQSNNKEAAEDEDKAQQNLPQEEDLDVKVVQDKPLARKVVLATEKPIVKPATAATTAAVNRSFRIPRGLFKKQSTQRRVIKTIIILLDELSNEQMAWLHGETKRRIT
jgi:hypothetical protein